MEQSTSGIQQLYNLQISKEQQNEESEKRLRAYRYLFKRRRGRNSARASTPLPRKTISNYRVILQVSRSSAETTADEEEGFDLSADSLESSCKRLRINSSLESIEPEMYALQQNTTKKRKEDLPDSPERDERMNSDVIVVEESPDNAASITSSRVAEYLEMVQQEDSASYFITPPGTSRKIKATDPQAP